MKNVIFLLRIDILTPWLIAQLVMGRKWGGGTWNSPRGMDIF
jgi:hypothetical protein